MDGAMGGARPSMAMFNRSTATGEGGGDGRHPGSVRLPSNDGGGDAGARRSITEGIPPGDPCATR